MIRTQIHRDLMFRCHLAATSEPDNWAQLSKGAGKLLAAFVGHEPQRWLDIAGVDRLRALGGLSEYEAGLAMGQLIRLELVIVSSDLTLAFETAAPSVPSIIAA
jgi:hypothetical protein